MTRLDLLKILVGQARTNGFDFRRWYTGCLRLPWEGLAVALEVVETQRRYYALLFHHDFAQAFWKPGETITFQVPAQSFERRMPDGSTRVVERKPFVRRSGRPDAWRYHLREMALSEEPLRYMRRYLHVEDDIVDEPVAASRVARAVPAISPAKTPSQHPPAPRPGLTTLALARKAAERRKNAVANLPSSTITPSSTRRRPRLPGSH